MSTALEERVEVLDQDSKRKYHHHLNNYPRNDISLCGLKYRKPWPRMTKSINPCCPECREVLDALGQPCINEVNR